MAALVALSALGAIAASEAGAQRRNPFQQSQSAWQRMDDCKRQAWKQNHDYTPEGNAKRDQAVRRCLEAGNLPPVDPQSPADPGRSSRQ